MSPNAVLNIVLGAILFVVLIGLAIILLASSRRRTSRTRRNETVDNGLGLSPLQHVTQLENRVRELAAQNAELERIIGEERAAHKAELIAVQSQAINEMQEYRSKLDLEFAQRKRAEAKSTAARSRTALVAKISEHLAPILPGFPYSFKECRWFGEIFDFLVFEGLEDGPGAEITVVFVEVKTRRSGARISNPREKQLKAAIDAGRVRYEIFIPDTLGAKADASS